MHKHTKERKVFELSHYGVPRCSQFGHYKYNSVQPGLRNHIHDKTLEICYFLKGRQFYSIDRHLFELTGNDILIVAPDTPHSTGLHPEDKGELFWLQISLSKAQGALCHLPSEQSDFLLHGLVRNSHTVFKGALGLKSVLMALESKLTMQKNTICKIQINHLILQLLLETYTLSENQEYLPPVERLNSIDNFIQEHIHRPIYVDELAALIGLSIPYFKEWFKRQKGIPPKEYINRLKIHRAKSDLITKPTITQVAFDLGYSSSQYFATSFKKYVGVTPKSYISSTKPKK